MTMFDRTGKGVFADRIIHEKTGDRMEVFFEGIWRPIEFRNGRNCIAVGGEWCPIHYTNDIWTVTR